MVKDIKFYLSMHWGGQVSKVAVPRLRKTIGPQAVFGSKHPQAEKVFDVLFTPDMWKQIVEQTNKYQGPRVRIGGEQIGATGTDQQ